MYFQRSLAEMKLTKEGRIGVWFKLQAKKFYCILLKGQIQTALFLTSKNCKKGDQIQIFSLPFTLHNRDIRLFSICHVLCSRKLELRVWRKMKNSLQQKSWYVNSSEMIKIWPYWTQSIVGFNRYNLFHNFSLCDVFRGFSSNLLSSVNESLLKTVWSCSKFSEKMRIWLHESRQKLSAISWQFSLRIMQILTFRCQSSVLTAKFSSFYL